MKLKTLLSAFVIGGGLAFAALAQDGGSRTHSPDLIPVVAFGPYQPIGVGVTSTNRLFVSFPNRGGPYRYGLSEVVNGEVRPFPNAAWNTTSAPDDTHFASVQDIYVDTGDLLWVLDSKPAPQGGYFKLIRFNIATGEAERIYRFDDLDKTKTALNDVRIDTQRQLAYLSDPGQAAIVVLDLATGRSRVVLAGSEPTSADASIVLTYDGREMRNAQGAPFSSHVNGIALTKDNRYFYFKPINKRTLYRIGTQYLADAKLSDADILQQVETVGEVGVTHGLEADAQGNIYLSTSEDYTIKYVTPDGKLHTLVQDSRIIWPDSLGVGTDGYLYFSSAQLNREEQWNGGESRTELPYQVFKVKLPR